MGDIDFTNLTVVQVVSLTILIAAIDTIGSMLLAATKGTFSLGYVGLWIQSHVLKRVFPILALAVVGHGIDIQGTAILPAIGFAYAAALAALAAYTLETIASIRSSWGGDTTPDDTNPVV